MIVIGAAVARVGIAICVFVVVDRISGVTARMFVVVVVVSVVGLSSLVVTTWLLELSMVLLLVSRLFVGVVMFLRGGSNPQPPESKTCRGYYTIME